MLATLPKTQRCLAQWSPLPGEAALGGNEVQVVLVSLDISRSRLEELGGTLSPDEQERAGRFFSNKDASRFIARRGLLRELLARHLKTPPPELVFSCGPYGKPQVNVTSGSKALYFSASHSDTAAAFAFTHDGELGVDIELIRPISELPELVSTVFSQREQSVWQTLSESGRLPAFFKCWTRKEAFLKGTGLGLQKSPNQIDICPIPRRADDLFRVLDQGIEVPDWTIRDLSTGDYAIALASTHSPAQLTCWRWQPG